MHLDLTAERTALEQLTATQLGEKYAELFGEPTHSRHRGYLIRKILWRLQVQGSGDLSDRARQRAAELAANSELRVMPPPMIEHQPTSSLVVAPVSLDPRLPPPGTILRRRYKGTYHEITILETGDFAYRGERFRSLSAVAKAITGSHVNGYRFFHLEAAR